MRKLITLGLAVATLGFLLSAAFAETKQFTNVNLNQLDFACIDAGGTMTAGKGPGGTGCKTKLVDVSCDRKGNCTCTGKCTPPARQAGGQKLHTLNQVLGAVQDPPRAPTGKPTGMPTGGILESRPGFAPQGPADTGKPTAPPAGGRLY